MEVIVNKDKMYLCDLCTKKFKKKDHIVNHINQVHLKQKVLCIACNEYFHALSLHRHRQTCLGLTERKFSCDLCNKRFKRADHMKKKHQEIHFEEKVQCSMCKKSMKESYVKRHQEKFCRGIKKELFILEATAAHQLSDESKWTDNIIIEDEKTENNMDIKL